MSRSPTPTGYDVSKPVRAGRPDCLITVGFDKQRNSIPRFLVRLHYRTSVFPVQWKMIARFDHNETAFDGHDVYDEGLHIDVKRESGGEVKLHPAHNALPSNRGAVIRSCVDYFRAHAQYFIDVYEGRISPHSPPRWPDGGSDKVPPRLMPEKPVDTTTTTMSREEPAEKPLSTEELTGLLAEATGTTADEIDRQAAKIDIEPPQDADSVTVVDE